MMEETAIMKAEIKLPPRSLAVGVSVSGDRESKYLVKWALKKFGLHANVVFKLLHVTNYIPNSQQGKLVATDNNEAARKISEMLLPYKKLFFLKQVQVDVLLIESNDVAGAIAGEVSKHRISKLIIGASTPGMFKRKLKKNNLSSRISDSAPNFCTVYSLSKGNLLAVRLSYSKTNVNFKDDCSEISVFTDSLSTVSSSSQTDVGSVSSYSCMPSSSLAVQRSKALSIINQTLLCTTSNSIDMNHSRSVSQDFEERKDSMSSSLTNSESSVKVEKLNVDFELEKIKVELRQVRGMREVAQNDIRDASCKLENINLHQSEITRKHEEMKLKEEEAQEVARKEKEKCISALKEVQYLMERTEMEASKKREAEMKSAKEAEEKKKLESALAESLHQYQIFGWEEIVAATSSFSDNLKIGMGAYGTVYKCILNHTTVAVKVLHSNDNSMVNQFLQELKVLSKTRHPHLLLLVGACVQEHYCLVYEFMENGSLEEILYSLPIPWFERYRIIWEIALALNFLHSTKPNPIVHRDLKLANILLDHNFVSKIGDVGLSKMVNADPLALSTINNDREPIGSFFYLDPEYQRSGRISPQCDVYAFGVVILQLLTGKSAMGLPYMIETAIDDDKLVEMLDPNAENWPVDKTRELALMGLRCTELRGKDRPDLNDVILPALERLKSFADQSRTPFSRLEASPPPTHFICPILKEIMKDPCVALDGYTYDRKGIEEWFKENSTSPVTNLPLPNKNLLPNHSLLSAITEWKFTRQ